MASMDFYPELKQMVSVTWKDTVSTAEWKSIDDAKEVKPVTVVSIGWVLNYDENMITVIGTVQTDGKKKDREIGDLVTIPTGCIVMVESLNGNGKWKGARDARRHNARSDE